MIDFALIGIVALSCLIGVMRGFFREAMSLLVWVAAIWISSRYGYLLTPYLAGFAASEPLRPWLARLILLGFVLLAGGLCAWFLGMLLHSTRLAGADRVIGMVFGLARGILVAVLAVVVLEAAGFDDAPWWRRSKLIPYAAPAADALREAAQQGMRHSSLISRLDVLDRRGRYTSARS